MGKIKNYPWCGILSGPFYAKYFTSFWCVCVCIGVCVFHWKEKWYSGFPAPRGGGAFEFYLILWLCLKTRHVKWLIYVKVAHIRYWPQYRTPRETAQLLPSLTHPCCWQTSLFGSLGWRNKEIHSGDPVSGWYQWWRGTHFREGT